MESSEPVSDRRAAGTSTGAGWIRAARRGHARHIGVARGLPLVSSAVAALGRLAWLGADDFLHRVGELLLSGTSRQRMQLFSNYQTHGGAGVFCKRRNLLAMGPGGSDLVAAAPEKFADTWNGLCRPGRI